MLCERAPHKDKDLLKVAVVCDWLVSYAGSERVLEQILNIYPQADVFCVVDFIPAGERDFLQQKCTETTFIQHLPGAKKHYRSYLPFMPLAIEQLDVSSYDLIISSSHAVAKGVLTGPDQIHICYIHSPMRYAWDMQHQYLKESGMASGLKGCLARLMLHYLRMWDCRTANGVDYFIANSNFISRRVKKVYGREADVIYPPVDVEAFTLCEQKENFYLTASRMVPYKKIKLIVEAFNMMPQKKLIVIGDGPEFNSIQSIAGSNVQLVGYQPFEILREKMQHARAFVFASEEDFGIAPVEAQACGTPVIAYGKGGARETVCVGDKSTGVFFDKQTAEDIIWAVERFEHSNINPADCRENALKFSAKNFRNKMHDFCQSKLLLR